MIKFVPELYVHSLCNLRYTRFDTSRRLVTLGQPKVNEMVRDTDLFVVRIGI